MWTWLCILLLVLIVVLLITPVKITVYYGRAGENDHFVLEWSVWFQLIKRKYEIPILSMKQTEAGPQMVAKVESIQKKNKTKEMISDLTRRQMKKWYHDYRDVLEKVHDLQPLFKQFFKRIRCTKLEWHTVMGTGQASETGAITGIIWGAKSLVVGVLSHSLSFQTIPRMSVQPIWDKAVIHTQLRCVLHFTMGHALYAGLRMFIRMRKRRVRKWEANPSGA